MHEGGDQAGGEHKMHGDECAYVHLARGAYGIAHQHQPSLHVAFDPTRALIEPSFERDRRFFPRWRTNNAARVTIARKTETEIGIFRDIVAVPTAGGAQNIGAEMIA